MQVDDTGVGEGRGGRLRPWLGRVGVGLGLVLGLASLGEALTVTLAWDYTQGPTPAVTFVIARQANCLGAFERLGVVPVPTQTYADATVVSGATYCYQVTALDGNGGESPPSNVLMVPALQPAPPRNLTVRP